MTFLFLFFFFWGVQSEIINHTNIVTKTCHNMESVCYQSATGWGQVNMQSVFGNTSINCDKSLKKSHSSRLSTKKFVLNYYSSPNLQQSLWATAVSPKVALLFSLVWSHEVVLSAKCAQCWLGDEPWAWGDPLVCSAPEYFGIPICHIVMLCWIFFIPSNPV